MSTDELVDVFTINDEVEKALVISALDETDLHYAFVAVPDRSWEGVVDEVEGHGVIRVRAEDTEKAIEIIHAALPDETEVEDSE